MLLMATLVALSAQACPAAVSARTTDDIEDWVVQVACDPSYAPCPSSGMVRTENLTEADAVLAAEAIADHGCWPHSDPGLAECCYVQRTAGGMAKIPPGNVRGVVIVGSGAGKE